MPTYRTGNNAYAIQSFSSGSTGYILNTASQITAEPRGVITTPELVAQRVWVIPDEAYDWQLGEEAGEGPTVHEGDATLQAVAFTTIDGSVDFTAETSLQAVAFTTIDGSVDLFGETSLQGVAFTTIDGSVQFLGEISTFGVATFTSDGLLEFLGESSLQGVAVLTADGELIVGGVVHEGESSLQAVATFTSEALLDLQAETILQGVATFEPDAEIVPRPQPWYPVSHGMMGVGRNRRRVRGSNQTRGRRIIH